MKTILFSSILLLVLLFQCCPASNVGEKVGEATPVPEAPEAETFGVGDVVKADGHTVTLNSASVRGGKLTANFTVENVGDEEVTVSSLLHFEARGPDGSKLGVTICDGPQLDGGVLPGDKLRADLCWEGVGGTTGVRIYYTPSVFSGGAIVWELE